MSYQVLARKWRSKSFDELIGQEPIVTALRNALAEGRIAQAYLFSGIRGVGKTTAARLLAKALNEDEDSGTEITTGGELDIIEIDAATYSKVDQIRELTESLQYRPAGKNYKVVIIDEVHRLSRQAFDALLKIVEEPPPHLVFIFATTEIEAVPATILSRCQEFHFRRVPVEILVPHLKKISESESITVSDTALRLIARAGEGSVRDSVALLDQLATFASGTIADEDAARLLGGLDTGLFERLLSAILEGKSPEVVAVVAEIEDHGWDPRSAFTQFLAFCRDALHLALGADKSQIDLPTSEIDALEARAKKAGYQTLLRLLNQLLASENLVRRSEAGILALEIAWLRAAELPRLVDIERLLRGSTPGQAPTSGAPNAGNEGQQQGSQSRQQGSQSRQQGSTAAGKTAAPPPRSTAAARPHGRAPRGESTRPTEASQPKAKPKLSPEELKAAREHPTVQAVLEVFEGNIESIVPRGPSEEP